MPSLLQQISARQVACCGWAWPASCCTQQQLDAWAMFFIQLHAQGLEVAGVFWGLWLFPFGLLIVRSGFIPKVLGLLVLCAGTAHPGCVGKAGVVRGWDPALEFRKVAR
jgi:hypothetical protein